MFVCFTRLQQRFLVFDWHGIEDLFLFDDFTFWALLLTIVFIQRMSFKFLFLRKHIIGGSRNTFIDNMFQCFFTASFTFGKVWLQVNVNGALYLGLLFCVRRLSVFLSNVFDTLSYISVFLYPLSINFSTKCHKWLWNCDLRLTFVVF